jgi:flagellar basal body-associated protein FliL
VAFFKGGTMAEGKSSKKWIIIIIVVIILISLIGCYFLLFRPNYSVSGKMTDITNKKPVADVTVSADGKEVKTDKNGDYKLEQLKKETAVTYKQPSKFEDVESAKINFKSKIKSETVTKDISLVPTVFEMKKRLHEASKYGQYDFSWDFMHPDDQAYWGSKDEYVNTFKKLNEIRENYNLARKSYKMSENIRVLQTWKHEVTGKEYKNVTEAPTEWTYSNNEISNDTTHLIKVNGIWRYFTQANKDETKKIISDYEQEKANQ